VLSEASLERMREGAIRGGKASAAKRTALGALRRGVVDDERVQPKRCTNCWLEIATRSGLHHMSRGRCNACARYRERTRRERPPDAYLRFAGTVAPERRNP